MHLPSPLPSDWERSTREKVAFGLFTPVEFSRHLGVPEADLVKWRVHDLVTPSYVSPTGACLYLHSDGQGVRAWKDDPDGWHLTYDQFLAHYAAQEAAEDARDWRMRSGGYNEGETDPCECGCECGACEGKTCAAMTCEWGTCECEGC